MTFFTYEKERFDGKGKVPTEKLEGLMAEKQKSYCSVSIEQVDGRKIFLKTANNYLICFYLFYLLIKERNVFFHRKILSMKMASYLFMKLSNQ